VKFLRRSAKPKIKDDGSHALNPWWLVWSAVREFFAGWKGYFWILAIILVPFQLIALVVPTLNGDATSNFIVISASIIMNVALLWGMVQRQKTGKVPRPRHAYYDGSVGLLRFMVVAFWLAIMAIPAILAMVIYIEGSLVATVSGTLQESLGITIVSTVLAAVSVWMFNRFGLATIAAVADNLNPLEALRYARRLTRGRFWRVFIYNAALIILIVIISLPLSGITAGLALLKTGPLPGLFFGFAATLIILPLTKYRSLQTEYAGKLPQAAAPTANVLADAPAKD
jgi:hypothetical protein